MELSLWTGWARFTWDAFFFSQARQEQTWPLTTGSNVATSSQSDWMSMGEPAPLLLRKTRCALQMKSALFAFSQNHLQITVRYMEVLAYSREPGYGYGLARHVITCLRAQASPRLRLYANHTYTLLHLPSSPTSLLSTSSTPILQAQTQHRPWPTQQMHQNHLTPTQFLYTSTEQTTRTVICRRCTRAASRKTGWCTLHASTTFKPPRQRSSVMMYSQQHVMIDISC